MICCRCSRKNSSPWRTAVTTARGEIECRVLVTGRIPTLRMGRRTVHQIGLPYHWGSIGLSRGDTTNELIAFVADPNVSIQESKALTGTIDPGRRSRQRRAATSGPPSGILPEDAGAPRDLPVVGERPMGIHGLEAPQEKEDEQA